MRAGEVTTVAPLDSLELSPATSYAVVFLPFPCLSHCRAGPHHQSLKLRREPDLGCAESGPRQCVFRVPPCPSGRPSSSSLGFQIVLFYSFHRLVYRFKNMYLLVGSFK